MGILILHYINMEDSAVTVAFCLRILSCLPVMLIHDSGHAPSLISKADHVQQAGKSAQRDSNSVNL